MFRDDECRVRTNHAPANFTTIKHMALNLLQTPSQQAIHCAVAARPLHGTTTFWPA